MFRLLYGRLVFLIPLVGVALSAGSSALADDAWKSLPPGPIRDRIELMEKIGDDAKAINGAIKAGTLQDAVAPARNIAVLMGEFDKLFPEGSVSSDSRAKKNIWSSRDEFDAFSEYLVEAADKVAAAAGSGDAGDIKSASRAMFKSCKNCHKKFRIPKEDE